MVLQKCLWCNVITGTYAWGTFLAVFNLLWLIGYNAALSQELIRSDTVIFFNITMGIIIFIAILLVIGADKVGKFIP